MSHYEQTPPEITHDLPVDNFTLGPNAPPNDGPLKVSYSISRLGFYLHTDSLTLFVPDRFINHLIELREKAQSALNEKF